MTIKKQKIVLIFFGVFLAFVFGELFLRLMDFSGGIYFLDQKTGLIILRPSQKFYWNKGCYKNLVIANSSGFHDLEFNNEKPRGVYRIAIIGDSQVESLQVPLDKTWHQLLGKKLNQELGNSKHFEVYAFGHSGNGQLLNYFYLKDYALKYKPDLVIDLFLVENDFRDDVYELAQIYFKQTGDSGVFSKIITKLDDKKRVDFRSAQEDLINNTKAQNAQVRATFIGNIAKRSVLATFLYQKFISARSYFYNQWITKQSNLEVIEKIPVDYQVLLKDYPEVWRKAWDIEKQLLMAINKTVSEFKAKFLLISSGGASRVHREDLSLSYISQLDFDKPENIFQEFTTQNHIPYLALTAPLRERALATSKKIMFPCDGHWNEVGHQWVAEILFDYLKNNPELIKK